MERDFLGLASKVVPTSVKENKINGSSSSTNFAPESGSIMQWSFSNKASTFPQFLSFQPSQEDRPKKTGFESLASIGLVTISCTDAFDPSSKQNTGAMQKHSIAEKPAGSPYTITHLPQHFIGMRSVHGLPVTNPMNQIVSIPMPAPVRQSFIASAGQNLISPVVNRQAVGGVSVVTPISAGSSGSSIVGTTDLSRSAPKNSGSPCQLTIFYNGSVCVYDDISPDKAQAIMLLAGNGPSATTNVMTSAAQVQALTPRPTVSDAFIVNQCNGATDLTGFPSAISITSHPVSHPAGGSSGNTETKDVKPIGVLTSPLNKSEPSKAVNSRGSIPATLVPSAVPQARKASLARFLEKRKERAITAMPYTDNRSPPDSSIPRSGGKSFTLNSSGSCPLSAINN